MPQDKLWNRNYCKVMLANFALFFAFYLLTPLLPLYLSEQFGATKDIIGIVLSGYTITALLARPFSGFLVDAFPRKKVLLICFSLFFIFFAGYLGATTLLLFALVRTLHGIPFGALTVSNSTVAIDVLPSSRRNEGIGYYGLSNNFAMAIAPSVAIFLYKETNSFMLLFWMALVIAGIGLAIDSTVKITAKQEMQSRSIKVISWDRFFLVRGWLLAVNMVFFGLCFGVLSNYLAIYSKEVMGRTAGTGTFFLLLSLGLVCSRLQGARSLREGRLVHNAATGLVLSTVAYSLFVMCPNDWGYYGSAILLGLGNGHMWPAFMNMMINIARHNERGTANSSLLVAWDVGVGFGVLTGGMVAEWLSYPVLFWSIAIIQILGTVIFFIFTQPFYQKRLKHT